MRKFIRLTIAYNLEVFNSFEMELKTTFAIDNGE
tara:strand:- start:55 stop:156 length:102 start_codon:yes stop_codon:yes gene_type:complete